MKIGDCKLSERRYSVIVPGCEDMTKHYDSLNRAIDTREQLEKMGYSSVHIMEGNRKMKAITGFGIGNYNEYAN